MSTNTLNTNASFNLDKWLAKANAVVGPAPNAEKPSVVPTPAWMSLKSGRCTPDNGYNIGAAIVINVMEVMDGIALAKNRLDEQVEELHRQEQRGSRNTITKGNGFGPELTRFGVVLNTPRVANDHPGFNPDGYEHEEHLFALTEECERLETVHENAKQMLVDILTWIEEHSEHLNLIVRNGYKVITDKVGNQIRKTQYVPLDEDSLFLALAERREFLASVRR